MIQVFPQQIQKGVFILYDVVDQRRVISFTIAIILFILAFLGPAAILLPLKTGFITREAQLIGTSGWSLITGGVGFLALAAVFVLFAAMEDKMKKWTISFVLFAIGVAGILLTLKDYYYYTSEHFVFNGPFTLTSQAYEWTDFESVNENLSKKGSTLFVQSLEFKMKDGKTYHFDRGRMLQQYQPIVSAVTASGGKHIRNGE
ncbi:hypothetical protein [Bhargavaea beijingensis]|uniref:PH domain-containing protein n=1 Tax=Bhargavaea beijingensis TaxID=426756 RepID=A0A1G7G800_9BACL|nr:hypothetical protein [Bhargavaea beijingensis]MCW1927426.1 hypothetical protein [Bhargavaea beijingensis]RSK30067.1 hypothetical protein EJA12_10170 [Bhargavaea beijingensis]SDE84195.1 hypothetical protein SAMN04488126_12434 [Bhargavaea beijingensis]